MYNPQLDTFVCVAELGSFSRAAAALYITPTAVIKQMNLLESRLGVTLFNRSHQGLTLTRAGQSLLADARHIIQYSNESLVRAHAAEHGEKRTVRVGVSPLTPASYLARLWPNVRERCPGMGLQVVNFENTQRAPQMLSNLGQDIDVICGVYDAQMLREHGCEAVELSLEPVLCAVSMGDDLASHERITFDDLHGRSLMFVRHGWNKSMDALQG